MMIGIALGLILGAVVAIAAMPGVWWHVVNQYELRCGMLVWQVRQRLAYEIMLQRIGMPIALQTMCDMWNVSVYARVWRVRTWYYLAVFGTV